MNRNRSPFTFRVGIMPDELGFSEEAVEEDSCLKNWSRWMKIRKNQQICLSKNIKRPVQCMLMNQTEQLTINKDLWLLEKAKDRVIFDKYRGHPDFWTVSHLSQPKDKIISLRKYDKHSQYIEKSSEMVGIPKCILEEKGIIVDSKGSMKNASSYVEQKKEEMREVLNHMDVYWPDTENLVVEGRAIVTDKYMSPRTSNDLSVPTIIIEDPEEVEKSLRMDKFLNNYVDNTRNVHLPFLRIENSILSPCPEVKSDKFTCLVSFVKCWTNMSHVKYVLFENVGTVAIHYLWKKVPKKTELLPLIHSRSPVPKFYFNLNDGILPPGQIIEFPFWYEPKCPGMDSEEWELITNPRVSLQKVIFSLVGIASEKDVTDPSAYVNVYIERCINNALADIAEKKSKKSVKNYSEPRPLLPYTEIFTEEELFLFKNPDLVYNYDVVLDLKNKYKKLFSKKWNLSVSTFIDDVFKGDFPDEEKEEHLQFISEEAEELMGKPQMPSYAEKKYSAVYTILCSAMNEWETRAEALRKHYKLPLLPPIRLKVPDYFNYPYIPHPERVLTINVLGKGTSYSKLSVGSSLKDTRSDKLRKSPSISSKFRTREASALVLPKYEPPSIKSKTQDWDYPALTESERLVYEKLYLPHVEELTYGLLSKAIDLITAEIESINFIENEQRIYMETEMENLSP